MRGGKSRIERHGPHDELRAIRAPVMLLIGDQEVSYDAAAALARARRLVPDLRGELVPRSSHDMCYTQHRIVDAHVLEFLKHGPHDVAERVVA